MNIEKVIQYLLQRHEETAIMYVTNWYSQNIYIHFLFILKICLKKKKRKKNSRLSQLNQPILYFDEMV